MRRQAPAPRGSRSWTGSWPSASGSTASAPSRTASTSWSAPGPWTTSAWRPAGTGATRPLADTSGATFPFLDSDVYKWLEAVGWELGRAADPGLAAAADQAIALVAAAQRPDGYLNSYVQVVGGGIPHRDLAWGHELYCVGHLIQAAVAWHRALGDDRLLEVAVRAADRIDKEFGPGGRDGVDGHPGIEMALVELTRVTGDRRYLTPGRPPARPAGPGAARRGALRRRLLAGPRAGPGGRDRRRPRRPPALPRLRRRRRGRRARGPGPARRRPAPLAGPGRDQDVPDRRDGQPATATSPSATPSSSRPTGPTPRRARPSPASCSAWRLLLATGEAGYADAVERAVYNGVLSGVSLDGTRFFYVNPLQRRTRRAWEPPGHGGAPPGIPAPAARPT